MINSVKNLVSFFLHRIGEQNLHEDIGDKKMALRKSAIEKMKRAIEEYNIQGVKTTLGFGAFVLDNRHFKSGDFDTHFIEKHFDPDEATKLDKKTSEIAALASILIYNDINKPQKSIQKTSNTKQKYWLKNRKK